MGTAVPSLSTSFLPRPVVSSVSHRRSVVIYMFVYHTPLPHASLHPYAQLFALSIYARSFRLRSPGMHALRCFLHWPVVSIVHYYPSGTFQVLCINFPQAPSIDVSPLRLGVLVRMSRKYLYSDWCRVSTPSAYWSVATTLKSLPSTSCHFLSESSAIWCSIKSAGACFKSLK